mgnify:CR=1 FL=1
MIVFTKEQLIRMHSALLAQTGGLDGLRDDGLLDSAIAAPFQTFDGKELFPDIREKAARIACGLIQNHPFIDGNKRIGAHAMLVLLALNGIELTYTQKELSDIILHIAASIASYEDLLAWILKHENTGA